MRPAAHTKKNVLAQVLPSPPLESHYSFVQNKLSFIVHPKLKSMSISNHS